VPSVTEEEFEARKAAIVAAARRHGFTECSVERGPFDRILVYPYSFTNPNTFAFEQEVKLGRNHRPQIVVYWQNTILGVVRHNEWRLRELRIEAFDTLRLWRWYMAGIFLFGVAFGIFARSWFW
jgi:hypothetical protein